MISIGFSKTGTGAPALVAYPGFGHRTPDGNWRIVVAGVAWQQPIILNRRQRLMIRMLGGAMKASPADLQSELFQDRIAPFMAEPESRREIIAHVGGQAYPLRKRTRSNGHFRDFLTLDAQHVEAASSIDEHGNRVLHFHVEIAGTKCQSLSGIVYLLEDEGTSIVSDIDDTIKDTAVADRRELLNNTFLRDFRSVEGMADVYQNWAGTGVSFHYVSSSPWQLFESLKAMNETHQFPAGTMHLRNFRLRDQLLRKIIIRRQGKTTAIKFLLKSLPQRKFVLVGDSGEKDPEIYRKICRRFPGRISALFIRELPHRPLDDDRSNKLTAAIPDGRFAKFQTAEELKSLADKWDY